MEYGTIKQAVKVMQAQQGLTQEDLARRVGVVRPVLSRTLGKPDHRITADLLPIAAALGCTLELRFIRPDGGVAAVVPYALDDEQSKEE